MKLGTTVLRVSQRRMPISFTTSSIGRKDDAPKNPLDHMNKERWNNLIAYAILTFPIGITFLSMSYGMSTYDSMTDEDRDDTGWPSSGDWY